MMQSLAQLLSMGNNPQQILQSVIAKDPRARTIINQMQQNNMSPQQFAIQYAKQNNIDIQPLIDTLRNRGIKL